MRRPRFLLAFALALAWCRRVPAPMPDVFTPFVGAWHRTSTKELSPSSTSGPVPPAALDRICEASYEGPGELDARLYPRRAAAPQYL